MRTSRSKLVRRILKVAAALVFFALCNALLTFALEPYGGKSQVIWDDYTKQDRIDTLFVGSSFAHQGFDPAAFDALGKGASFNLASPNQSLEDSYVAVRTAYEDFGISRVVLGVSYSELYRTEAANPQSAFLRERARATGKAAAAQAMLAELFQRDTLASNLSINGFFPWVNNHVDPNAAAIAENVRAKAAGIPLDEAAVLQDPTWTHQGQGFGVYEHVFNPNTELGLYFNEAEASGELSGINPNRETTLRALCDFCSGHGIQLVAVVVPLPAHNIEYYGKGYFEQGAYIADYLAQWEVPYYDLNLARPDFLQMQTQDYYDYAHLNGRGAKKCSAALANLLQKRADGESLDSLFYSEDEFWASLTSVSAVLAGAEATADGLNVSCKAFVAPSVLVEFQICLKGEDGTWNVARDWAAEPTCFIEHPKRGAVEMRVNARSAQSARPAAEAESWYEFTAFY